MADNRNQNWNTEDSRSQQPDQRSKELGTEQRTGTELGQHNRNQPDTGDRQSGNMSESNLGEQSEKSSRDAETEDI